MRFDRPWPAWHPKQELSAEHLLGLEDYLIARATLADDNAWGVDLLNWPSHITTEHRPDGLLWIVRNLRGVTRFGEPVFLYQDSLECLSTTTSPGALRLLHFDLWIDVNTRGDDTKDGEALPPKLVLRAEQCPPHAAAILPGQQQPHSLYLGRYFAGAPNLRMEHRPFPRRLGGVQPLDERWKEWVAPLQSRIEEIGRAASGGGDARRMAAATDLLRLGFEWAALPIPALARRLMYASWLLRANEPFPSADFSAALIESWGIEFTGNDLPQRLSDLLPTAVRQETARPQASSLPASTSALIAAIAKCGVDYFAPIDLLDAWVVEIGRLFSMSLNDETAKALIDQLQDVIADAGGQSNSGWISAIALITLAQIEAALGRPIAVDAARRIGTAGSDNVSVGAGRRLAALYVGDAFNRRAGPMAFYYLSQAGRSLPEFARNRDLARYLEAFTPGKPVARHGALLAKDRIIAYPMRLNEVVPTSDPEPFFWWSDQRGAAQRGNVRRLLPPSAEALKVTVAGFVQSGKSSLLERLSEAPNLHVRHAGAAGAATGAMSRAPMDDTTAIPIVVDEIPLDDVTSYGALAGSNLTVFTISPENLGSADWQRQANVIASAIAWLASNVPDGLVALAYTKADEYGVVTPAAMRIVEQRHAPFMARLTDSKAWDGLTGLRYDQSVRHDFAIIGRRGGGDTSELAPTRQWLLDRSRPIWTALSGFAEGRCLLNAYFVCAQSADARFARAANQGVQHLAADFARLLEMSRT